MVAAEGAMLAATVHYRRDHVATRRDGQKGRRSEGSVTLARV